MSRHKKRLAGLRAAKDRRAKTDGDRRCSPARDPPRLRAAALPRRQQGLGAGRRDHDERDRRLDDPGRSGLPAAICPGTAAAAAALATGSTKLPNSDVAPSRMKSQLYSFDTFASKDPFVQQVRRQPGTSGTPTDGYAAARPRRRRQTLTHHLRAADAARSLASAASPDRGERQGETVGSAKSFPNANPVFRLVSLATWRRQHRHRQRLLHQRRADGPLSAGRSLTLVDTADGVRYKVRLLSAS